MATYEKSLFLNRIRRSAVALGCEGVDALGPLYDLTAPRLFRYAFTLTRNRADAEDALQASMVRIVLKPQLMVEARHPWAYFLKIVRNESLNIIQHRKSFQLLTADAEMCLDVSQIECDSELQESVRSALRKLPPTQAEVVVLKIWEELTFIEIGEVLDYSPNTVASRYRYALGKLEKHLLPFSIEVFDV